MTRPKTTQDAASDKTRVVRTEDSKSKLKALKKNDIYKLKSLRLQLAEFKRQYHFAMPEANHPVKDTLKPEYWAHVASKMQMNDRIEAIWEDGSKLVEYTVIETGEAWAKVAIINEVNLLKAGETDKPAEDKGADYEVKWNGRYDKFIVVRLSDNTKLAKDFDTKEAADTWLVEHKGKILGT